MSSVPAFDLPSVEGNCRPDLIGKAIPKAVILVPKKDGCKYVLDRQRLATGWVERHAGKRQTAFSNP